MNTIRQKIFCFYLGYYKKQALKLVLFNTVSTCCKSWLMRASFPALNTVHGEWIHFSYSSSGSHLLTAGEAGQVKGRDAPWGPGKPRTRSCLILPCQPFGLWTFAHISLYLEGSFHPTLLHTVQMANTSSSQDTSVPRSHHWIPTLMGAHACMSIMLWVIMACLLGCNPLR